jgi:anti-sigma B factor antagonist
MPVSGSFSQGLHIETSAHDGTIRLVLYGELDLANAGALNAELHRAESSGASAIVVDLRHLRFIDPTGVGIFLRASHDRPNPRLQLLPGPPHVQRTFRLCGAEAALFAPEMRDDGDSVA